MTVESDSSLVQHGYVGPSVGADEDRYNFLFKIFNATDIQCIYYDTNGQPYNLVYVTDYTVIFDPQQDPEGGIVRVVEHTDPEHPLNNADGDLVIQRVLPVVQETDWVNNDPFDAEILETDLDKIIMIIQQLYDYVDMLIVEQLQFMGEWQPNTYYRKLNIVTYQDKYYSAKEDLTSGSTFDEDNWTLLFDFTEVMQAAEDALDAAERAETAANLAEQYRDQAQLSESNALIHAQQAANCAALAFQEASQITLPDINPGDAGKAIVVNPTEDGWILSKVSGLTYVIDNPVQGATGSGYGIDASGGPVSVELPPGTSGEIIAFVDLNGQMSDVNTLTLTPNVGQTIMGAASPIVFNEANQAVQLTLLGTDWRVINQYPPGAGGGVSGLTHIQHYVDAAAIAAGLPIPMGNAPAGQLVQSVQVEVITPFDGGAQLAIGTQAQPEALLAYAYSDLAASGAYGKSQAYSYAGAPMLYITPQGAPLVGDARVTVYFN